jgi:ribosomal subunit interface protein
MEESMHVQLTTDNHIEGSAKLTSYVQSLVTDSLQRFNGRLTRVEVHLSDENSGKKSGSNDKRCSMEARVTGRQPVAVNATAPNIDQALDSAVNKLEKALATTFGRLEDSRNRRSASSE